MDADFLINVILENIVASYFNATLITFGHSHSNEDQVYPAMFPIVQVIEGLYELGQVMENFAQTNNISNIVQYPSLIRSEQIEYTFGYCALPKKMWESVWDFRIFCEAFSITTWLELLLMLILVSIFISLLCRPNFCPFYFPPLPVSMGTTCL